MYQKHSWSNTNSNLCRMDLSLAITPRVKFNVYSRSLVEQDELSSGVGVGGHGSRQQGR